MGKKKKVLLGQSNLNFLSMFIWLQDDFYLQPSCFIVFSQIFIFLKLIFALSAELSPFEKKITMNLILLIYSGPKSLLIFVFLKFYFVIFCLKNTMLITVIKHFLMMLLQYFFFIFSHPPSIIRTR